MALTPMSPYRLETRRIGRLLLIAALLILGAGFLGLEYLNRIYLPLQIRSWAEISLSEFLGRRVAIGKIQIHPWHGIVIDEIVIGEDRRYGRQPFLQIDRITGKILYLPILKNHRFHVTGVKIDRPRIRFIQDPNGVWNFQSLRFAKAQSKSARRQLGLFIPRLSVSQGEWEVISQNRSLPVDIRLRELEAQVNLALPAEIRCSLSTTLVSDPENRPPGRLGIIPLDQNRLELNGSYDLRNQQLNLQCRSTIALETATEYLPPSLASFLTFLGGTGSLQLDLTGDPKTILELKGLFQTEGLHWAIRPPPSSSSEEEGEAPAPRKEWIKGRGDLRMNMSSRFSLVTPREIWTELKGGVDLNRITIGPVPYLGSLKELTGYLSIDSKGVVAQYLTGLLPTGHPIVLKGSLANDSRKTVSLGMKTTLPLPQVASFYPQIQTFFPALKPSGTVIVTALGEGALRPQLSLQPVLFWPFPERKHILQ